eukprot:TRINITY_DN9206_c0_g1_i1.p1 TRINITY_DN9206_c0_g1~~TRINITY_DN9206_c0_g1_i1.p1  ORF type:complete len:248 (-),score=12.04 TRINITY_DN9206_c0_g1_i1:379-1122(-)
MASLVHSSVCGLSKAPARLPRGSVEFCASLHGILRIEQSSAGSRNFTVPGKLRSSLTPGTLEIRSRQTRGQRRTRRPQCPAVKAAYFDEDDEELFELSFVERLQRAWRILFPPRSRPPSYAEIAKERLRLVLYTDRGEVSPEVRRRLRRKIIDAISAYVEIESEEDVQLNVSADPDIGTVYSITIPVRRVKPEYQEYWSETGFRDRFYEEILRERGPSSPFTKLEIKRVPLEEEAPVDSDKKGDATG